MQKLHSKTKLAAATAILAVIGAGASQNAAAFAYGAASTNIYSFSITLTGNIEFSPTLGQVNGSATASRNVNNPVDVQGCSSTFGAPCDTPVAQVGDGGFANNNFQANKNIGTQWARADGRVPSNSQSLLISEAKAGSANVYAGASNNTLAQQFVFNGPDTGNDTIAFQFNAQAALLAELNGGAEAGSQGQGSHNFTITLTRVGGSQVFNWEPDGQAGGITGGTENSDPFNLNNTISALNADDVQSVTFNLDFSNATLWSAVTNDLVAGTYNLSVSQETSANATFVKATVPEPASLALVGLGLAGVGVARSRRKARG